MSWNHDAAVENRKIPTFLGQLYQASFCSNIVNSAITFSLRKTKSCKKEQSTYHKLLSLCKAVFNQTVYFLRLSKIILVCVQIIWPERITDTHLQHA